MAINFRSRSRQGGFPSPTDIRARAATPRGDPRRCFWVALPGPFTTRLALPHTLAAFPALRALVVAVLPYALLSYLASPAKHGFLAVLFADGTLLETFEDPTGDVLSRLTDAAPFHGDVYFASPSSPVLTRIPDDKVDYDHAREEKRRRPKYVSPNRGVM